jgi:hypothetical protein
MQSSRKLHQSELESKVEDNDMHIQKDKKKW